MMDEGWAFASRERGNRSHQAKAISVPLPLDARPRNCGSHDRGETEGERGRFSQRKILLSLQSEYRDITWPGCKRLRAVYSSIGFRYFQTGRRLADGGIGPGCGLLKEKTCNRAR